MAGDEAARQRYWAAARLAGGHCPRGRPHTLTTARSGCAGAAVPAGRRSLLPPAAARFPQRCAAPRPLRPLPRSTAGRALCTRSLALSRPVTGVSGPARPPARAPPPARPPAVPPARGRAPPRRALPRARASARRRLAVCRRSLAPARLQVAQPPRRARRPPLRPRPASAEDHGRCAAPGAGGCAPEAPEEVSQPRGWEWWGIGAAPSPAMCEGPPPLCPLQAAAARRAVREGGLS